MESNCDVARVKEEPNDTWTNACDDYVFNSVDSCKAENCETFPIHESSAKHANETVVLQERLDEKIFIDFECKNVKTVSTTICKYENQICQPIVKGENENQTNNLDEKSQIILIKKELNSDNNFQSNVAWMLFDQSAILTVHNHVITRNPRISVSHDKHRTWYLHISNVQEEDKGRYMCQINTATAKTQYGYLHVVVPPNIDDSQSSSDVIVREGANVSLSCNASGSPTPSIRWKRDDNNKININKTLSVTEWLGNTLEISRISRLDMGNYLCIASNNVPPSVSKQIKVSVDFPPMLWIPHQLVGVPLGYSVTLECHTEAHPTSLNYWTRSDDGVMIHESRKYRVLSTPEKPSYKTNMTLTIYDVEKSDYDSYKCMAKNPRGETEGTIRLYESTPPSTSPNPVTTELASKEWDITPELNNSVYGNPSSLTIHNDKKKGGKKTPSKLNEISKHEQKFGSLDKKRNMELSSSNASALETATTASTLISLLLLIAWIIR